MARNRRSGGIRLERGDVEKGVGLPDWWQQEWRAIVVDGKRVIVEQLVVNPEPFVGGGLVDGDTVITDDKIVLAAMRFVVENSVLRIPA